MPALILLLVLLGISGGVQVANTSGSDGSGSAVLVGGEFGGIVDSTTDEVYGSGSYFSSNPTPTVLGASTAEVQRLPVVDTLSAQDISEFRATMRGEVTFTGAPNQGSNYFVYSDSFREVVTLSENARQLAASSLYGGSGTVSRSVPGLSANETYYYRLCFEAEERICGDVVSFTTVDEVNRNTRYIPASATTREAENIQAETAELEGSYRLNDSENATAFFVYGTDRTQVTNVSNNYSEYSDIDEDGDALQRLRAGVNIENNGERTRQIDDLEKGQVYYHSFCVAYDDDEDTAIRCGSVGTFTTKDRVRDIPQVRTMDVSVTGTTARVSAVVDMEDFSNGHIFLVYGTDQSRVERVEDVDEFRLVYQYGDSLQRVSIDDDLDGRDDVATTVRDLSSEDYFYTVCIEYETEDDDGRDDIRLACHEVETFTIN